MIVVTTPTGQIGRQVLDALIAEDRPVRVIVRDIARLDAHTRRSVEIVEGSHGDAAVITAALEGAESLFWIAPSDPRKTVEEIYIGFTQPAAEAIRRRGVRRVVTVTALGRNTPWERCSGLVTGSIGMDDLLMDTGAHFRGLAMPSFMDNMLRQATLIREQGIFIGSIDPDRAIPMTATRDLAAIAAGLLGDGSWLGQEDVPVIGPEDLSHDDIAAILSEVLGREVRYRQVPLEDVRQQLLARGASASFAQGYIEMFQAKNDGMDNAAEAAATGRTATSFRYWVERHLKPTA